MWGGRHVIAEGFSEDIWLDQEEKELQFARKANGDGREYQLFSWSSYLFRDEEIELSRDCVKIE